MTEYLITDTVKEIIYKNKKNILTLFSEYDKTNITIQQLQTELTNLGIKIGDYTSDDTTNVLDHNVSVIKNLAISVDNSNAISARVKSLEEKKLLIKIKDIANFDYNGNTDKEYEFHFRDPVTSHHIIYRTKFITITTSHTTYQYIDKYIAGFRYTWFSQTATTITLEERDGTIKTIPVSEIYYNG